MKTNPKRITWKRKIWKCRWTVWSHFIRYAYRGESEDWTNLLALSILQWTQCQSGLDYCDRNHSQSSNLQALCVIVRYALIYSWQNNELIVELLNIKLISLDFFRPSFSSGDEAECHKMINFSFANCFDPPHFPRHTGMHNMDIILLSQLNFNNSK